MERSRIFYEFSPASNSNVPSAYQTEKVSILAVDAVLRAHRLSDSSLGKIPLA